MFEQSIIADWGYSRKGWTVVASTTGQIMAVGLLLLVPLIRPDALPNLKLAMRLQDPPPPPPPPVVRTVDIVPAPRIRVEPGKFYAPPTIPPKAARILDDPQLATVGVIGGLPGPSGGPNRDGVVGSVMEKVSQFVPPPPPSTVVQQPKPTPAVPIRVASGVLAANPIHKVVPTYPRLAPQARISGTVRLQGCIANDGRILDLQLRS